MGSGASTLQEYDALPSNSKKAMFDKLHDEFNLMEKVVAHSPSSYDLTVTGHVMEICNGFYRYAGEERGGSPKWVKFGAKIKKEGHSWEFAREDEDVGEDESPGGPFGSGVSPPTRPDQWDGGSLASVCTIRIEYMKRPMSSAIGTWGDMLEDMYIPDAGSNAIVEEHNADSEPWDLEDLKAKVAAKNMSAVVVVTTEHETKATVLNADFPLKPEHCRPITEWEPGVIWGFPTHVSSKLFIYTPPPELTKLGQKISAHRHDVCESSFRLRLIKKPEVTEPFFDDEVFAAVEAGQEFLARPIVMKSERVRLEDPNRQLLALGVMDGENEDFITLRFDKSGGFLKWKDEFCLEVSGYEENSTVYLVRGDPTSKDMRRPECSRSFTIERASAGGCLISPVHAPHLQLGIQRLPAWPQELPEDLVNMQRAFRIVLPQHEVMLTGAPDSWPAGLTGLTEEEGEEEEEEEEEEKEKKKSFWFIPFWNELLYACPISSIQGGCIYSLKLRHPRPGAPLVVLQQQDSHFWFRPEKQEGDCFRLKALVNIDPKMEELQTVMAKFKKIKNDDESFFMEFNEFASALTSMNPKLSDQDVSKAFARVDTNKDGKIDLYEYLKMVKAVGKGIPLDPELYLVYRDHMLVACEDATEASLFRFEPCDVSMEQVDVQSTPRNTM